MKHTSMLERRQQRATFSYNYYDKKGILYNMEKKNYLTPATYL